MHKPLLLLLSAGCIISCNKDASKPVNNWTWFGTSSNSAVYNYVLINASQIVSKSDSSELHIGVSAAFIDSNNHQVTVVRALSINNFLILPEQNSTYYYDYGSNTTGKNIPVFGTSVMVTIHGETEGDSVSSSIYVPKELSNIISDFPDTVSLNRGLQLNWTPDNENTWGKVEIQLYYYSTLSKKADSTLPDKINTVSISVPDNGSYFLNKTDMKDFPPNAFIGITIARGTQNEAMLPLSHKRVYYFSNASLSTTPVMLIP